MTPDEYLTRVNGRMAGLMARRQAPWVRSWSAAQLQGAQPFNPVTGAKTPYTGLNALLLQTYMLTNGLHDPRFVTVRQAQAQGWSAVGELSSGVDLHFVPRTDVPGDESGRVYTVHHVSEFANVPSLERQQGEVTGAALAATILERSGVTLSHDQVDRAFFSLADGAIHIPSKSSFADEARFYALAMRELAHAYASDPARGASRALAPLQTQLRAELASLFIGARLGLGHEPGSNRDIVADWIKLLQGDRAEFASAAQDAQRITNNVFALVAQQSQEASRPAANARGAEASTGEKRQARTVSKGGAAPSAGPRTYLAVPFGERFAASRLGAEFDENQKVWWIGPEQDASKFSRWLLTDATLASAGINASDVIAEFETLMRSYGLVTDKPVIDDGKWHYVPTDTSKGYEKNGSYVLDMTGIPNGAVQNFKTGESTKWKYGGGRLTPEQRAARDAQAREVRALREREAEQAYMALSDACERNFASFSDGEAIHPYLVRKGVRGHGVRIVDAADVDMGQVLNVKDFSRGAGSWLVIPGRDVDGKIWTLQAIHSNPNGAKLFTKNAKKKGAFHIVGADSVAELASAPIVAFAEGYATGASVFEATGIPVVIGFDSMNLPDVVKAVSERLPKNQPKVICADNDQFFADKLIARVSELLAPEQAIHDPKRPCVAVLEDGQSRMRNVPLRGVADDNEWHQTRDGKYRFRTEAVAVDKDGAPLETPMVNLVSADIVDGDGKMTRLSMYNAGLAAAEKAAAYCDAHIAVPAFTVDQLPKRPTDFNDLAAIGGREAVSRAIESAVGAAYTMNSAPTIAPAPQRRASLSR
ncbi:zincin-like metallopeptidase domain-containing protein [Paraburkholderia sp. A3RO-2L]|uniref:zincin-like metallopeptidase domain-containing protein n=1 Tax=Paraburkholderia sp. A3RO-2L TaxID=3028376 RepID=UPI003DA905F9